MGPTALKHNNESSGPLYSASKEEKFVKNSLKKEKNIA